MENIEEAGRQSCPRWLRHYQSGEYFSMWSLTFYQEMVVTGLYRYYPYESRSKGITALAYERSAKIRATGSEESNAIISQKETGDKMLAHSYLIRCLIP